MSNHTSTAIAAPKLDPMGKVELRKGLVRYYYVVKSANGQVTSVSEKYYSKYNAERAAFRAAKQSKLVYTQRI